MFTVNGSRFMIKQEERWQKRYEEVKICIETNHQNPSRYDDEEERGRYCNWMKHNKKLYAAEEMK